MGGTGGTPVGHHHTCINELDFHTCFCKKTLFKRQSLFMHACIGDISSPKRTVSQNPFACCFSIARINKIARFLTLHCYAGTVISNSLGNNYHKNKRTKNLRMHFNAWPECHWPCVSRTVSKNFPAATRLLFPAPLSSPQLV